jgi:hypothetical protein
MLFLRVLGASSGLQVRGILSAGSFVTQPQDPSFLWNIPSCVFSTRKCDVFHEDWIGVNAEEGCLCQFSFCKQCSCCEWRVMFVWVRVTVGRRVR